MADAVGPRPRPAPHWRLIFALAGRTLAFIGAIFGTVFLLQLLLWAAPGDPIDMLPLYGEELEQLRPELETAWGLDLPAHQRLSLFISHAIQGDLGESLVVRKGSPVLDLSQEAWASSIVILLPALAVSVFTSLLLAWFTAGRRSLFVRPLVQVLSILPIFLFVCFLVVWDEYTWSLIESGRVVRPDWFPLVDTESPIRTWLAILVLGLGSNCLTELHAATENSLVRIRDSGFVMAARARGAPTWPTVIRNLMPELVQLAASRVPLLIGGLVILERIFNMNGAGALIWRACVERDYPLALGLVLGAAILICLARLVADIFHLFWDPRAKEETA